MSKRYFFKEMEVTKTAFSDDADMKFDFDATKIIIANDTSHRVEWIFIPGRDSAEIDGALQKRDQSICLENLNANRLWLRVIGLRKTKVRVWAWGNN